MVTDCNDAIKLVKFPKSITQIAFIWNGSELYLVVGLMRMRERVHWQNHLHKKVKTIC